MRDWFPIFIEYLFAYGYNPVAANEVERRGGHNTVLFDCRQLGNGSVLGIVFASLHPAVGVIRLIFILQRPEPPDTVVFGHFTNSLAR